METPPQAGLTSRSPEETERAGKRFAAKLKPGDVLALTGEIGAGKTTFVRGLAEGLGAPAGQVASPSFVLVREYHGRMPIYHADLFRLEGLPDAMTVGLEDFYQQGGVTVIEWANQVPGVLPEEYLEVSFRVVDPETRRILLFPHGKRYRGYDEVDRD